MGQHIAVELEFISLLGYAMPDLVTYQTLTDFSPIRGDIYHVHFAMSDLVLSEGQHSAVELISLLG